MKTLYRLISGAAAAAVLAGGIGLVAPLTAAADDDFDSCHLNKTVDKYRNWDPNRSLNIMVYRGSSAKQADFQGIVSQGDYHVKACATANLSKVNYHWVVFSGPGTFVLHGDGGYRNWAFYGSFTISPDGKTVEFHTPPKSDKD